MTSPPRRRPLVLTVHPTTRGFGWVVFEGPLAPVDWGIAFARGRNRERLMCRFERLLSRYEPSVLILEEFEHRVGASLQLCRRLKHMAACRDMDIPIFTRETVQAVFTAVGARTRYEIAQVICSEISAFSHWMPRKRTLIVREDAKQSLFDAAALAVTYYKLLSRIQP